jgi:hypothetical protein
VTGVTEIGQIATPPIAKRTAEVLGGGLTLSCPPQGGTVVTLSLPIQPAAHAEQRAQHARA